ncbi:hypothetical protein SAMN05421748_11776 [Paractinoplanes atraurantiacus]|uniref:Uncharacterized protein n=1 Tax=Paractinoplanes atraurantiacus TaxID=1036182 RepID=A0A285J7F1_9ACTN|nr:hypothetical protein SAMN05421748_11776 [Actinoplanes atraurantiacus]
MAAPDRRNRRRRGIDRRLRPAQAGKPRPRTAGLTGSPRLTGFTRFLDDPRFADLYRHPRFTDRPGLGERIRIAHLATGNPINRHLARSFHLIVQARVDPYRVPWKGTRHARRKTDGWSYFALKGRTK